MTSKASSSECFVYITLPGQVSAVTAGRFVLDNAVNPNEAARLGLVHESVSGKALDRAMEIARRLASRPQESVAAIKRLVRNATETPLAQGLALERNLFLKLCISDAGLARMRSYEAANITSPARSIEVDERKVNRG